MTTHPSIPIMKTGAELLAEARTRITEVSVEQVMDMQRRGDHVTLLDVRDPHEVNVCKIPGAVCVSRGNLESKIESQVTRDANVVIYCASGNRSVFATETMKQMGYDNVASMTGGIRRWIDLGGDVE
jgi:sulfur-carrier protein adenylyltransferase/sulfurtransferase